MIPLLPLSGSDTILRPMFLAALSSVLSHPYHPRPSLWSQLKSRRNFPSLYKQEAASPCLWQQQGQYLSISDRMRLLFFTVCMGYFDLSLSLTIMHSELLESSWPLGSRAQHGICETARRNGIFLDPQVEASMLWDCLRLATDVLPCLRFYIYYIIYIFHIFLSNPFGLKEIERNTIQAAMASDGRCSWSRVIPQGEHPLPYEVSMASLLKTSSLLWYITFMSFTNNKLKTIYIYIYIYIHIQICTYVYPSLSLCLSFCLSIKLSIYISIYLSI